jgi:D-alanyl-D-alanine carboxypeptidase
MKKCVAILTTAIMILGLFTATVSAAVAFTPNITAASAVILDFETGEVLFSKDEDRLRPPASMTKNVTVYIIFEEIAAGRLSPDTLVTVSQNAVNISRNHHWHSASIFHRVGAQHTVEEMLRLIMLVSHDGACIAMAEHISGSESAFVERMNETVQRMGIHAYFDNPHGLWGNLISARGMAEFVRNFIIDFPDILGITGMRHSTFGAIGIPNTNELLRRSEVDGFKTGTTSAAGWCLSFTAIRNGNRIVAVTMNSTSHRNRYSDAERLVDFGLNEADIRAFGRAEADRLAAEHEAARIALEAAQRAYVSIDGELIEFDVRPRLINGRVLAPVRAIAEPLGGTVAWNNDTQTVTITKATGSVITLVVGDNTLYINDNPIFEMDVASEIWDGRVVIPVRFIVEAMGATVEWNGNTRTAVVRSGLPITVRRGIR